MIDVRKVAGLLLLVIAILGTVPWYQGVSAYVAISEAQLQIPRHVAITDVMMPEMPRAEGITSVTVLVQVGNPSNIAIEVFAITYRFYMDNLTDTRTFWEKEGDIYVAIGGFYDAVGGYVIPARTTRELWANLTVYAETQPQALQRLNTSFNGRFYPILLGSMHYRFPGVPGVWVVRGLMYSSFRGVVPSE